MNSLTQAPLSERATFTEHVEVMSQMAKDMLRMIDQGNIQYAKALALASQQSIEYIQSVLDETVKELKDA